MHRSTLELLQHLDGARARLVTARDAVPESLRERRPGPERWSVANVLSHLARTESQVAALLRRKLRRALAEAPLPAAAAGSVLSPTDVQRLLDRGNRVTAPDGVQPELTQSAAEAWSELEHARRTTREVLLAADGLQTEGLTAPHPLLGTLTFHQWFAFLGYHERRHAEQVDELRLALVEGV